MPKPKNEVDDIIYRPKDKRSGTPTAEGSIEARVLELAEKHAKGVEHCLWCSRKLKEGETQRYGSYDMIPFFCSPNCAITWAVGFNAITRRNVAVYRDGLPDDGMKEYLGRPLIGQFVLEDDDEHSS